jgi:hypothetical protein
LPLYKPTATIRRKIPRSLALVPKGLLELFGRLVDGCEPWPLFLHGSAGTGKTCAVLALCDVIPESFYLTSEDAADSVIGDKLTWQIIAEKRLVVVDELGSREKVGDLHYQAVKRLADLRDRQPTVYVTNITPDDVGRLYDDRIASRLLCGSIFELAGDDRRMQP